MTLVEVLDTAIKIGLGATLTGLASYFIARHNHDRDLKKMAFARRLETLEQVAEKAELHFSAWRRYCASLGGIYSGRNPPDPDFSESQWQKIRSRDKDFLESREGIGLAVARLRLLGLTNAADLVNEYNKVVGDLRDPMILHRKTPSHEIFKESRTASTGKIREFYAEISKAYLDAGS